MFGTLPSTRTMNLQAALFLAWSYTLYLIIFAPSLKSVSGSWPTSVTLQRDQNCKQRVFHRYMWNKGKLPHTRGIYQQCLLQPEGPRSPERWVFQVLQTSVWTGDTWSLEGQYLETYNKEGNSFRRQQGSGTQHEEGKGAVLGSVQWLEEREGIGFVRLEPCKSVLTKQQHTDVLKILGIIQPQNDSGTFFKDICWFTKPFWCFKAKEWCSIYI